MLNNAVSMYSIRTLLRTVAIYMYLGYIYRPIYLGLGPQFEKKLTYKTQNNYFTYVFSGFGF